MPSGKFCSPMPMASAIAEVRLAVGPRCHRAERHAHRQPLGEVMQRDGQHQQHRALPVRLDALAFAHCQPRVQVRQQLIHQVEERPAARNPVTAGSQPGTPAASAMSMAGSSSEKKLAAIITPAAKPSIETSTLREMVLLRKTNAAPRR